ncbi:MAG: hypothetical protein ACI35W_03490 [Anaeroplasmataceae bacterium]
MKLASKILALICSVNILVLLCFSPVKEISNNGFYYVFKCHTIGAILLFVFSILVIVLNIMSVIKNNYRLMVQLDAPIFKILNIILSIYILVAYACFNKGFMSNITSNSSISYISVYAIILTSFNIVFNVLDGFVLEK